MYGRKVDEFLERLGIPVLDFSYRRHVAEIVWKLVKLFDTMCETNGKLLCKELAGLEESSLTGVLTEEDHLLQRYTGLGKACKVMDLVPEGWRDAKCSRHD